MANSCGSRKNSRKEYDSGKTPKNVETSQNSTNIRKSAQEKENFTNKVGTLDCLNTLDQSLLLLEDILVIDNELPKNNSIKCSRTNDKFEIGECSQHDSKRVKTNEDGLNDSKNQRNIKKDCDENESSSDEELENEDDSARCFRVSTSAESPLAGSKEHGKQLFQRGESLNSLSTINDALPKIQNEDKIEHDRISEIPEDVFIQILVYLTSMDIINLLFTSPLFVNRFAVSRPILRLINIFLDKKNYNKFFEYFSIFPLPFINLSLNFEKVSTVRKFLPFLKLFSNSIENLEIRNANFKNFKEFFEFFNILSNLKRLNLEKCNIEKSNCENLPLLENLSTISFNKCNDNIFEAFVDQKSLEKITVRNDAWTWSGFPHDIFNLMAKNAKNLQQIVFIGLGTGSFFDFDQFLFNVRILDTTMISFHWYVGIRDGRIQFLQSQKGFLKELTIHQLPFDFDGGKVLKYIIEEMKLEKFSLGKTPLILDGQKQLFESFEASEIQIQAIYEMFRQFPAITSFCLNINETDIASDAIEAVINPPTNLFDGLQEFKVNDNSKFRSTFGVFLGLVKNFRSIRRLILNTQDRNINTLLGEFLPIMAQLTEIYLPSTAPRVIERFKLIRTFVPNLSKISVASPFFNEAKEIFGQNVNVIEI